jgi:hypothetical protein
VPEVACTHRVAFELATPSLKGIRQRPVNLFKNCAREFIFSRHLTAHPGISAEASPQQKGLQDESRRPVERRSGELLHQRLGGGDEAVRGHAVFLVKISAT